MFSGYRHFVYAIVLYFIVLACGVGGSSSADQSEFVPALRNHTSNHNHNKYGHLSDRCYNQFIKNYIFNQTIISFDKRTMILGCYSGTIREIKSCHDRMEAQFRKSTFKECSYSDQCLLFGDNPSLFFNADSERARRNGKEEYSALFTLFPEKCSQSIVESLVGREAILFFFKQSNISIDLTKELVRGFFKENLQYSCENYTENALESLRLLVSEMPEEMYSFLSLLEFKESQEQRMSISITQLIGFSVVVSLLISSFVLFERKSKNAHILRTKQLFEQKLKIMKNLLLKLKEQDQHITQAESSVKESAENGEKFRTVIEEQEKKISELENHLNRALNDSKAKENTLSQAMKTLNQIRDVVQTEKFCDRTVDLHDLPDSLKQIMKEKAENDRINKEKKIKAMAERNELEWKYSELFNRMGLILEEKDELDIKVNMIEESLSTHKENSQALEDSVLEQSEHIGKLLLSLKMKEDKEQKLMNELENSQCEIKKVEQHLRDIYKYFGIYEDHTPQKVESFVLNLREESDRKTKEIDRLVEDINKLEEVIDEKVDRMLEADSKITSLLDENSTLKSQLIISTKRLDSKHDKISDNCTTLTKELEISQKLISKLQKELDLKIESCNSLGKQLEDVKEELLHQTKLTTGLSEIHENNLISSAEEKTRLITLMESLKNENEKKELSVEELTDKLELLEKEKSQLALDLVKVQMDYSNYKIRFEETCEDLISLKRENSELSQSTNSHLEKYTLVSLELSERSAQYESAQLLLQEKSRKIEEISLSNETLNKELAVFYQQLVEKDNKVDELSQIVNEIQTSLDNTQGSSLGECIKDMKTRQEKELSVLETEIISLRLTLENKSKVFVDYQQKIDEVTELLEGRSKQIDELSVELQFLKKEKNNLEEEIIELRTLMVEKERTIKELSSRIKSIACETLNREATLNEEIEALSKEKELMKEKVEKMDVALSKKVNKIDDAFNYIQVLNSESENLSSMNKTMEDKYMKLLFEKKQFNEQKDKYEKLIESLRSQNEKLLDELNNQQMTLLKIEKSNKNKE